ncbi:MAG: NYN domain-containing protein [Nitrospirota bacterium]
MANILIDGYNIIGTAHDNLEKSRNDLIDKIRKYSEIKGHHVTLVFDGWKSGQKDQTMIRTREVAVIYSRLGEKADLVIKRLVNESKVPWIVVSSDREISEYSERHGHAAVSSAEFEEKLYHALKHPAVGPFDTGPADDIDQSKEREDDAAPSPARSRGNPRKLSKKRRNRMEALNKL